MKTILLFLCLVAFGVKAQTVQKWAVVGCSIEKGDGLPVGMAWPWQFQDMNPNSVQLLNYGVSGACFNLTAPNSMRPGFYKQRFLNRTHVMLGNPTNDCQATNAYLDTTFCRSYQFYIDSLKVWCPGVKIYCCTAIKSLHPNLPPERIAKINNWVRKIAKANRLMVWDFNSLPVSILSADGIHPDQAGATVMALYAWKEFAHRSVRYGTVNVDSVRSVQVWQGLYLEIKGNTRTLQRK